MSSAHELENLPEPAPFFDDARTMIQKLGAEKRSWLPHKPAQNCPATISGLVVERSVFTDMNDRPVPTPRLLSDDLKVEWSIIAFHAWLRREVDAQNPRPGDYILVAYGGTTPAKRPGESDAHIYQLILERNPARRAEPEEVERGDESVLDELDADGLPVDDIPF